MNPHDRQMAQNTSPEETSAPRVIFDQAEMALAASLASAAKQKTILIASDKASAWVDAFQANGAQAWAFKPGIGRLTEGWPEHWDLSICPDGLVGCQTSDAEESIEFLCSHSLEVWFFPTGSSTQPLSLWLKLFARRGYIYDPEADLTGVSPERILFRQTTVSPDQITIYFASRTWQLEQEINKRRLLEVEQQKDLSAKEDQALKLRNKNREIQNVIIEKDGVIQDILNSHSWRLMTHVQGVRRRLVPINSGRERLVLALLRGVRVLRREGPLAFGQRLRDKISWQTRVFTLRLRYRRRYAPRLFEVEPIYPPLDVPPHQASVDIIVCVHNALDDVRCCLESVLKYTSQPYSLLLVDDGSEPETKEYLEEFAREHRVALYRNEQAEGYTRAAALGQSKSTGEFLVMLNSDTIVTLGWLDKLVTAALQEGGGLSGPLSNTASWQSIPDLEFMGDWAENPLPEGVTVDDMGRLVEQYSARLYPRLPFLNGFCLMIRRQVLDQVGIFDVETFGQGFGEENDYALRARKAGWKLVLADDAYVFHAQSRSYTNNRRKLLSEQAGIKLAQKHGQKIIDEGVSSLLKDRVLIGIRARSRVMFERQEILRKGREAYQGKRILFILPIQAPGGGGNIVIREARAMRQMGVDAQILNLKGHQLSFERAYPGLNVPVQYCEIDDIPLAIRHSDAAVATFNPSVFWMAPSVWEHGHVAMGYYNQDYEPYFYPPGSEGHRKACESYSLIPNLKRFSKTEWTSREIETQLGVDCTPVGASFDLDLFRPRPHLEGEWPDRPLRIAAMVRPNSAYREPWGTMEVLREITHKYGPRVEILIFGTELEDPGFIALPRDFDWRLAGIISQQQAARLFNEVDIFVDFSTYQAMGLTAMEAMGCGAAVIVPQRGGACTFARDDVNCLVIDTNSPEARLTALCRLIDDPDLRVRLQQKAITDICAFYPEKAAFNILHVLFSGEGDAE